MGQDAPSLKAWQWDSASRRPLGDTTARGAACGSPERDFSCSSMAWNSCTSSRTMRAAEQRNTFSMFLLRKDSFGSTTRAGR